MRTAILIALAALLAAPARGQLPPGQGICEGSGTAAKASREFAENFNAANSAYAAADHAAAMNALERARPHAKSDMQRSYIAQTEIAIMIGAGADTAAIPKLEAALNDPCVKPAARQNLAKMLGEARAKAGAPKQ